MTTDVLRCLMMSFLSMLDSQDGELDAILKELNALGSQFEQELKTEDAVRPTGGTTTTNRPPPCLLNVNGTVQ